MTVFSGQFDWSRGLIWSVGFSSGDVASDDVPLNESTVYGCDGLVDTGASNTCISTDVAAALNLAPTGKIPT